jgi:hypothetical protein
MDAGPRAGQPVDSHIHQLAFAPESCQQSAGDLVLLEDAGLIAVYLSIDTGARPGHACANDEDGFYVIVCSCRLGDKKCKFEVS